MVCSTCGAVPVVTSHIDERLYAVVNVLYFLDFDRELFDRSESDFEGETVESRLGRRARTWIPAVTVV